MILIINYFFKIQGLDGDTGRAVVLLTVAKENVYVLQHTVRLVTDKEYSQYSKCISKYDLVLVFEEVKFNILKSYVYIFYLNT